MIMAVVINMIDTKHMDLDKLAALTRENLRSLGYGDRTIYMVNSVWRDLAQFLGSRSKLPFLPLYGLEYLHERIGYPECLQRKLTPNERDYIRAVRMLTSFQESGTIPDKLNTTQGNWFVPINDFREAYVRHCDNVFRTHGTKRSRIAAADRFMQIMMVNRGISVTLFSERLFGKQEYPTAENVMAPDFMISDTRLP